MKDALSPKASIIPTCSWDKAVAAASPELYRKLILLGAHHGECFLLYDAMDVYRVLIHQAVDRGEIWNV